MRPQRHARRLTFLPVLLAALALVVAAAPAAARTPTVRLDVSRPAATRLVATVTGHPFAGAWRVTASGTGAAAARFIRVEVTAGDDQMWGRVVIGTRAGGRERILRTQDLTGYLGSPSAAVGICDERLGLCVESTGIRVPVAGDSTLRVTFRVREKGARYTLVGGVRVTHDTAFTLGRWISTGTARI